MFDSLSATHTDRVFVVSVSVRRTTAGGHVKSVP